jgi:HAD superfamily hydrolase (TIGR01549 family)
MLEAIGLEGKPGDVIQGYIGLGKDRLISDALGHGAAPDMVKKALDIFDAYYSEHMLDHTRLFPGVMEILEYLKDKRLMVVTNKSRDLSIRTLKHFGIDKYFNKVIGGDDLNCRKPAGCSIESLLGEIKVLRDKAIIIGDSDIDVKTGILTCGLTYGIGRKKDLEKEKPDYMLDDIRKLKDIIY